MVLTMTSYSGQEGPELLAEPILQAAFKSLLLTPGRQADILAPGDRADLITWVLFIDEERLATAPCCASCFRLQAAAARPSC